MKRFLVPLLLAAALSFFFYEQHAEKKRYLKSETLLRKLDLAAFRTAFKKGPSPWMKRQIDEDFSGISITQEQIETTYAQVHTPYIVRYRIHERELYRYFPPDELISTVDNSTEKAIKTLLHLVDLPDLDFMISYLDGTPLPGLDSPEAPILVPAKHKNLKGHPLIPDWRSLGEWWLSDIKSVQRSMAAIPWESKKSDAVWRGSVTNPIRVDLCRLSKLHPDCLDAKINLKIEDPLLQQKAEEEKLFGDRLSWDEFLSHKYLPIVDGVMCAAPALQWRLLSNSVTFLQQMSGVQWFYGALEPFVHYIPVKADLSDLIEKLKWAKDHDSECKEIAEQATRFAQENLLFEHVLLYFAFVLKEYSSHQTFERVAIEDDPRWINITHRSALPASLATTSNPTPY